MDKSKKDSLQDKKIDNHHLSSKNVILLDINIITGLERGHNNFKFKSKYEFESRNVCRRYPEKHE